MTLLNRLFTKDMQWFTVTICKYFCKFVNNLLTSWLVVSQMLKSIDRNGDTLIHENELPQPALLVQQ